MAVILIYLLEMTALDPFQTGIFRRIICVLYVLSRVPGLLRKETLVIPGRYLLLVFPFFVQCFQDAALTVPALARSISWFLYVGTLRLLLKKRGRTPAENYTACAKVWVYAALFLALSHPYTRSANGDWTGIWANRNMTVSVMMSGAVFAYAVRKPLLIPVFLILAFRTGSRMAAVMSVPFLLFLCRRKRSLLFLPAPLLLFQKIPVSFRRLFAPESASSGWMRGTWKIGVRLFLEKPFLGHGMHSSWYYTFVENSGGWGWGMHTSWLILPAENGLAGSCFFIAFFAEYIMKCRRIIICRNIPYEEKRVLASAMFLTFMLGVNALSESFLFSPGNVMSLPFWLSFMLADLYRTEDKNENTVSDMVGGTLPGGAAE